MSWPNTSLKEAKIFTVERPNLDAYVNKISDLYLFPVQRSEPSKSRKKSDLDRFCEIHRIPRKWLVGLKFFLYVQLNDICNHNKFQLNRMNRSWDLACEKSPFAKVGFSRGFRKIRIKIQRINIFWNGFHQNASNTCLYHIYENEHDQTISIEHLLQQSFVAYVDWLIWKIGALIISIN